MYFIQGGIYPAYIYMQGDQYLYYANYHRKRYLSLRYARLYGMFTQNTAYGKHLLWIHRSQ